MFHSLLKPLKWLHPLVFILNDNFKSVLDSPIPLIVGINEVFLWKIWKKIYIKIN
jgi:hypothetical protein